MPNCEICGKKIGLFDGKELENRIGMARNGPTITVCEECSKTMEKLKLGVPSAWYDIHEKVDGKASDDVVRFISIWEKVPEEIAKKLEEEQKAREAAFKVAEEERIRHETRIEQEKQAYANSFREFYEYDVVTVVNEGHGCVDKDNMMKILSDHAREGWRLHSIYSNELGKNAIRVLGFGVNSTACEDVLIFERRLEHLY